MALKEDSLTQWHSLRRVAPTALHTASWDYRMVDSQRASAEADAAHDQPMPLAYIDQPGAYAFETAEQVARLAEVQLQALSNQRKQFMGKGTVRTMAPGTTFELSCIDPVKSCSGVNVEGNDDEHRDGRRHQALDSQA